MCEACNPCIGKIRDAKVYSEVLNPKTTRETHNISFILFSDYFKF
jgi:hypothetical protein